MYHELLVFSALFHIADALPFADLSDNGWLHVNNDVASPAQYYMMILGCGDLEESAWVDKDDCTPNFESDEHLKRVFDNFVDLPGVYTWNFEIPPLSATDVNLESYYKVECNNFFFYEFAIEGEGDSMTYYDNGMLLSHVLCDAPDIENSNADDVCVCVSQNEQCSGFSCYNGFELASSNSFIMCGQNGRWLTPLPECVRLCSTLSHPANGDINCEGVQAGDECEVECDSGFEPHSETLTCLNDGEWDGVPECIQTNCFPPNIGDDCCSSDRPCGEGEGDCDPDKGQCASGLSCGKNNCREFHADFPSDYDCCVPLCSDILDPANGDINCEGVQAGDECEVECNSGFEPQSETLTCLNNGEWDGVPECIQADCFPPYIDAGCCSSDRPCGDGEGDCDPDEGQCASGLLCKNNNCREFHADFPANYDCCVPPSTCQEAEDTFACTVDTRSSRRCDDVKTDGEGSNEVCGIEASNYVDVKCSALKDQTYEYARDFCETEGFRLCSVCELMCDEAANTGCRLDLTYIWSSTRCDDGYYLAGGDYASGSGTTTDIEPKCTNHTELANVRCCGDE